MPTCHMCNDQGKPGGCPRCGLTQRNITPKIQQLNFEAVSDIIPVHYQGVMWKLPSQEGLPLKFQQYDLSLEKVYNKFLEGTIPTFSVFIAAPPKSDKTVFAYSCMQTALISKFTVAPLLSTGDWRRLLKVSQMNPFYKLYNRYKWDELIATDVVFLYIDHSDDRYDDIPLLKSIFDARSMFNLPTFVISDYKLTDLVPKWNSNVYTMIYNSDSNRDYLRYPVILHRFE